MPSYRVLAWIAYDWAFSAFNTVVVTFVLATYFVQAVAPDPATGTAQWAAAQTVAGLVIAALAAPLGVLADQGGHRRALLTAFTLLLIGCTALLWFVRPGEAYAMRALVLVGAATVGSELAGVFYNAMLPELAPPARVGLLSGLAWGAGYLGGIACLAACLFGLIERTPPPFGLDPHAAEPVRATALLAAAWIAVFAAPLLLAPGGGPPRRGTGLRAGMRALGAALRQAASDRRLVRFLLARMLYTDGLTTLFAFGAIYAAGEFRMDTTQVLLLGIVLNVTGGIGAIFFAFADDRLGAKPTVLIALGALTALSLAILLTDRLAVFWGLAMALGLFVGPAQAASRSLMARIAPAAARNAQFGLFALSGRVTGFVGPAALGAVTAIAHSQRAGMAVIVVLLAAGGLLLAGVRTR
ncbi:MAG: MFS transporter [Proteobacteria bacterium]|nr:MFS transporter [Pseudomonadota bacterium]